MLALQEGDEQWTKTDDPLVFVACSECMRVYSFETQKLEERPSDYGLSPYNPEAPMHVFPTQLRCDAVGCGDSLTVLAVRRRNISPDALKEEKEIRWHWQGLTCPSGHSIRDREKHGV